MYSFKVQGEGETKKAKGVKKNVARDNIKHDHYKEVLQREGQTHHKMRTIRSDRRMLRSYE